jgi:hypothetical protein
MSITDPGQGQDLAVEDPNTGLAADEGGYTAPDVEADQDAITEQVFTALAERVPGWQAHDGNLETWLTEAWAESASEIRALCKDVPASIFMTYGENVLGIAPQLALPATGLATFTAIDDQGYTLDASSTFGLNRAGDDVVAFQTTQAAEIPPDSTQAVDVPFAAIETGADGNGLAGDGQMLDPITWVQTVTVTDPTATGQDAEDPQDYLDRLTNLLRMVALRPVLPQDFAILALQIEGVGRAVAMNLYDPADGSWDNERTVTVMITDDNGQPVPADVKQQVVDYLESLREVNWVVHVIDPTYDTIDVAFEVTAFAGQQTDTVLAACQANLELALAPASYRLGEDSPSVAGGEVINPPATGTEPRRQYIRMNDLVALLDRTLGVDWVQSVLIDGTAGDYQLPDPYALPTPGTMTGTVNGATT